MNILDLTGPEFLLWYGKCFGIAAIACVIARWLLSRGGPEASAEPGPYEVAWLRDGPRGVAHAALAALFQRGDIELRGGLPARLADHHAAASLAPAEEGVWRALGYDHMPHEIADSALAEECELIEGRLADRGLALSPERRWAVRCLPPLGMSFCMAIGVAKVRVGLARERPVGLLVMLLVLSAIAVTWALIRVPRATAAGRRLLTEMSARHAALRTTMESREPASQRAEDVALAVGLWGVAALAAPTFWPLTDVLEPRRALASQNGSGCGGYAGGGCGGSCGGGCGGGCGGCGS